MTLGLRMLLLVVVLVGLASLAWVLTGVEPAAGVAGDSDAARWQSSRQCAECHRDVWDEWQGSHHQIAYLNPEVRKLSDDFKNKECQACHLPRPIAVTGYGQRTLPRLANPDEGVSCLTCHLAADGGLLARTARPDAPCRPRASADLTSVELCASCHNQHQTTDQWRASPQAAAGQDCNHCHMPEVARGASGNGRAHVFPGAHDAVTLRAAARFGARLDGSELVLTVENHGAGHNFPTEERHRAVDIMVGFASAEGGVEEWKRAFRFRQPYRDEPGEDTQLPAGQTREVRVAVPAEAAVAHARLWYRLNPFCGDADPASTLLFEEQVALR